MGLYDDRIDALSEPRRSRSAERRTVARGSVVPKPPTPRASEARRSMQIQSLLFSRDDGWTASKAKSWAQKHGYKYGDTDVTDQYVRLRQFSPKGLKVKRTITLGRGIRAVVAREESMAQAQARRTRAAAPRKRKKTKTKTTRRRKTVKAAVAAPRRKKAPARKKTTRRRRTTRAKAWYGDTAGHRRAAKKGVRRRKARKKSATRRRRRTTREPAVVAAPRRRRRRSAPRRTARRRVSASTMRAPRRKVGMSAGELAVAVVSAGFGFVLADGLDRFLATYNPASTEEKPKDKFTSDGAGTLANTLNVASPPGFARIGAGIGMTAIPAVASMYVDGPFVKRGLEGLAIGSGVALFKTLWNNLLMPMLKPKDTSPASLQKSYIARLYPAEVAASINREQEQTAVSSAGGAGALSGPPADVGPFALAAQSPYPDAEEALRRQAGMAGTPGNDYPTVQQAWGTGGESDYPTATQAMSRETGRVGYQPTGNPGQPGVSQGWEPGPPPLPGPGPQAAPGEDPSCACLGEDNQFLGFIGDEEEDTLFAAAQ